MNENIYLGNLIETINNVNGVINVIDLRIYNKINVPYSLNEISMPVNQTTRQITPTDYTIFSSAEEMSQIRFPAKDIVVRIKN